jgi:hypothetical protein
MLFLILTLFSAIFISCVAGWFSISGLVAIFPDATIPIICMGVSLEIAKLVGASFIYKNWDTSKALARGYLLIAVIVLSCISSVGVFGYLSKNHLAGGTSINAGQDKIAFVQRSIDLQVGNIKAESTATEQMNKVVNNYLLDTAKVATAEKVRNNQAKERQRSKERVAVADSTLLALQLQKDSLSNVQRITEIHVGPLLFLGQLFGTSAEKMVRWFILVIVFVTDPLAICLVLAANAQAKALKKMTIEPSIDIKNDTERPLSRLYEPKLTSKLDGINERMMETMDDTHDFGFTDPPSRPIIQVIHP